MNRYGQAAIKAVELIQKKISISPVDAWEIATIELFGEGTWGQKKGCPKNAFLGLCEEGLIKGVSPGVYNSRKNSKNKDYAVRAVQILLNQPEIKIDVNELWDNVMNGYEMSHNYQMDVVVSLWNRELIRKMN